MIVVKVGNISKIGSHIFGLGLCELQQFVYFSLLSVLVVVLNGNILSCTFMLFLVEKFTIGFLAFESSDIQPVEFLSIGVSGMELIAKVHDDTSKNSLLVWSQISVCIFNNDFFVDLYALIQDGYVNCSFLFWRLVFINCL